MLSFRFLALAIMVMMAAGVSAQAQTVPPSFDCREARSGAEHLICSNDDLARLDRGMDAAFRVRRDALDPQNRPELIDAQQFWLSRIATECELPSEGWVAWTRRKDAVSCLDSVYRARVAALALPAADGGANFKARDAVVPVVDADGFPLSPRITLARIQSDLERVAAGKPRWPLPQGIDRDPLEQIVDAYTAFLKGNTKGMDAALNAIGGLTKADRPILNLSQYTGYDLYVAARPLQHFENLDKAAQHASPLVRLLAGLRRVDTNLFLAMNYGQYNGDWSTRDVANLMAYKPSGLSGSWLRLPCRTVVGRAAQFAAVTQIDGPLLSCPTEITDYSQIETLARDPGSWQPKMPDPAPGQAVANTEPATPPPPPWDVDTAFRFMGDNPDLAEPALASAAKHGGSGAMDYALFLHSFRKPTPARNRKIKGLLDPLVAAAEAADSGDFGEPASYDGTDASLVPILQKISESGAMGNEEAFQVIPCAVLIKHPDLIEATEPQFFTNRDNFLPRSGCAAPGAIPNFPEADVKAFTEVSHQADGDFIDNFGGSFKYGLESGENATLESMKLEPRTLIGDPPFDYPYQTWGYTGFNAYMTSQNIRILYLIAKNKLELYYRHMGLDRNDAASAAKGGLFNLVLGADCGGKAAEKSLRGLLLQGAPYQVIKSWTDASGTEDSPEVMACEKYAPVDPLVLSAVADSAALPLILSNEGDVDARNDIGKTALMVAAQFDEMASARVLLAAKAQVNASTVQGVEQYSGTPPLSHDARTPLMYAAESGSLQMIELLLAAGADPYQADTKGSRAIDYLLGFGPTGPNPNLTPAERAEAARLLF